VIPILFKLFFIFLPVAFLGMIILTATKSHPEIHEHVSLLFLAFGPIYLLIFFSFLKHSFLRFSDLITDNSSQPLAQADRKG